MKEKVKQISKEGVAVIRKNGNFSSVFVSHIIKKITFGNSRLHFPKPNRSILLELDCVS